MVVHQHAFDDVAIKAGKEKLDGVILLGRKALVDGHGNIHVVLPQVFPEGLGQVGHFLKGRALGEPCLHLTCPERRLTHLLEGRLHVLEAHAQQDLLFAHISAPSAGGR